MTKPQPYRTSDYQFAAFLCLHGYTLAGAMPADDGTQRVVLFLFWTKPDEIDIHANILALREDYDRGRYQAYANKLNMCRKSIRNPITEEQLMGSF